MIGFTIRRLLAMLVILFGVTLMVFLLMSLAPGDFLDSARADPLTPDEYVEQMEKEWGLDQPWYTQYGIWLKNVVQGDFGQSWRYRIGVFDLLLQRVPATLILSLTSILFTWLIAIPLGILAAIYKDSIFDRISSLLAYAALSIPEFFLALLAVMFAAQTGLFPTGGRSSPDHEFMSATAQLGDLAYHLILPTIVLGIGGIAGMMRIMRANFIDYMRAEFVNTARAKGLGERVVMFKHVLRNAINPLITAFGYTFASLLSGALLVENVMNYPGLGQLIFQSIVTQDQYVVLAGLMVGTFMLMSGNFLADLLLAKCDPRIRLEDQPGGFYSLVRGMVFGSVRFGKFFRVYPGAGLLRVTPVVLLVIWLALRPWQIEEAVSAYLTFGKYLGILALVILVVVLFCGIGYGAWRFGPQLVRRPMGFAALLVLGLLYMGALFAPMLAPYQPNEQSLAQGFHPPSKIFWQDGGLRVQMYEVADPSAARYEAIPGESRPLRIGGKGSTYEVFGLFEMERRFFHIEKEHEDERFFLLGADSTGRDIFSRLLYGARISLTIGLIGISITMTLGFIIGGVAAYFGGNVDFLAMRMVEFLMAVPGLYLLLTLRSVFGEDLDSRQLYFVIVVILAIIGWAGTARVIRGMALSIRNRPFVLAAEAMGQSSPKILFKHLLPNLASYLLVAATLSIPGYILGEAALSFLGLGIQDPDASWGLMLSQAQQGKVFMLNFWWMFLPGVAIFLTVIAFNVLGDELRDIIDPKGRIIKQTKT
ncbi:MAG: ABC transporter permease subunit [Opitutales bacterium]|nr:ABC transporter permease subunit [Opitutales bacterium]